jgi:hypothetical protein
VSIVDHRGELVLMYPSRLQCVRRAVYKPPFEGVRLIGHRWSARSYEIKDLLARNHVPFQWLDVQAGEDARELLAASQITPTPDRLLVIVTVVRHRARDARQR